MGVKIGFLSDYSRRGETDWMADKSCSLCGAWMENRAGLQSSAGRLVTGGAQTFFGKLTIDMGLVGFFFNLQPRIYFLLTLRERRRKRDKDRREGEAPIGCLPYAP